MRMNLLIVTASLVSGVAVAGCGGAPPPPAEPAGSEPAGVVQDTRTPLEKRLDAACQALEPRLVSCAVEDSRAELTAGRITQPQFDQLTAPGMLDSLRADWAANCNRRDRSSRQVRVLEVCFEQETACAPLLDCLEHLTRTP